MTETGAVLWRNNLKGFGRGLVSLASSRGASNTADGNMAAVKRRRDAQNAAAHGAAAG
jgi:hypothetical protein